jgi:hypothetical protein
VLPAAHVAQAPEQAAVASPAELPNVPAGQSVHAAAPTSAKVPGGQGEQTVAPAAADEPAAQGAQDGGEGAHAQLLSVALLVRVPGDPLEPAAHKKA